jgi:GTP-binding protein
MELPKQQHFVDYVQISVKAGHGGQGCISFLRDRGKPFGGPNGGDGGRGGSIWLEADESMTTLLDFKVKPRWIASGGEHGMGKNCSGRSGEDITLKVPLGTTVLDAKSGESLGDLTTPGQRIRAARGGDGGRGNQHFHSATNKAPRKAEAGWPGDERLIVLELKLLADAGVVGLPNAGKSTLLAKLTSANPRIAPYPFTTLSPNLGVFLSDDSQTRVTLADIPGLIEGAHKGAGLGDRFLRHIMRTKVLVHLVAPEAGQDPEGNFVAADATPETLLYAYRLVEAELGSYSPELLRKPRISCLSKIDELTPEQIQAVISFFEAEGITLLPISGEAGDGMDALRDKLVKEVLLARASEADVIVVAPATEEPAAAPTPSDWTALQPESEPT